MATRRPLKWQVSPQGLRKWSDADLDRLSYELRVAFAVTLDSLGTGHVSINSGVGASIGETADTRYNAAFIQHNPDNDGGPGRTLIPTNYPSSVGGLTVPTTYRYYQERTTTAAPLATQYDASMWMMHRNAFLFDYISGSLDQTQLDLYETVIDDCIDKMRFGDYVGTYFVSTNSPNINGSGTWNNKGTIHVDTRYTRPSTGQTVGSTIINTTNLYLKMNLDTPAGISQEYFRHGSGSTQGFQLQSPAESSSDLIQNILLPILKMRSIDSPVNGNSVHYTIENSLVSSVAANQRRGSFTDTFFGSSQTFQAQSGQTYYNYREPAGTIVTGDTFFLTIT